MAERIQATIRTIAEEEVQLWRDYRSMGRFPYKAQIWALMCSELLAGQCIIQLGFAHSSRVRELDLHESMLGANSVRKLR